MVEIIELFALLAKKIKESLDDGISQEEIARRVMAPGEVGSKIIAKIADNRNKIEDFIVNG